MHAHVHVGGARACAHTHTHIRGMFPLVHWSTVQYIMQPT